MGLAVAWPDGLTLASRSKNALPRWDAPADPQIVSIEAFPKSVSLETAADFHRVIIIAHFKDPRFTTSPANRS
ncbi:MAG: hypothetical protein QM755_18250 [Luteolibacter sp.]